MAKDSEDYLQTVQNASLINVNQIHAVIARTFAKPRSPIVVTPTQCLKQLCAVQPRLSTENIEVAYFETAVPPRSSVAACRHPLTTDEQHPRMHRRTRVGRASDVAARLRMVWSQSLVLIQSPDRTRSMSGEANCRSC